MSSTKTHIEFLHITPFVLKHQTFPTKSCHEYFEPLSKMKLSHGVRMITQGNRRSILLEGESSKVGTLQTEILPVTCLRRGGSTQRRKEFVYNARLFFYSLERLKWIFN
jgi:hypothetical protein